MKHDRWASGQRAAYCTEVALASRLHAGDG